MIANEVPSTSRGSPLTDSVAVVCGSCLDPAQVERPVVAETALERPLDNFCDTAYSIRFSGELALPEGDMGHG